MSGIKSVFLVVVTFLLTPARGDVVVSCVFMESCILPCGFQAGAEVVIHWIQQTAGDAQVHSFYHNRDQVLLQNPRFKGRTSLFNDQISRGNASLLLKGVVFKDQGRYKCYTSTITGNKESFINLNVDAPVRKVNIQLVENRITCSSDGIYPAPKITWSTIPPSNVILQNTTEVQQTEQQLYNINSSLMLSDSVTDLVYICTVSTRRNSRRATLSTSTTSMNGSSSETTIPCTSSNIPLTSLIWRFNHSQTILTQTGAEVPYTVSQEWSHQVMDVSKTGTLTLKDLSSKYDGIYTCELNNGEEAYITNTFLRIKEDSSTKVAKIVGGVVGAIFLVVLIVLGTYCMYKKVRKGRQTNQREARKQQNPEPSNGVSHPTEQIPLNETENEGGQR